MKEEFEVALVKKYPELYKDHGGDMRVTCMHWGFVCGDGWYDLIDKLSAELSPFGVVAAQVKEKWGGLRFYVDGTTEENDKQVYEIIGKYEKLSYKTCENCGQPGKVRKGGWVRTLCDNCVK